MHDSNRGVNLLRKVKAAVVITALLGGTAPLIVPVAAHAQSGLIRDIEVEGNNRIETATVNAYLTVAPGDSYDIQKINSSLKALFSTGLFADVSFSFNQGILRVNVVENPIINRIAFEGNQRLDDDTLSAELQLRPRVVYTRTKVQADVQRILELYRRSGRFAATVEPKVIQLDQNRVDLAFEIDEGDATGIRKINFVGNKAFDDGELSDVIRTTESAWWKILTADDNYDPDRVTFDRELLRRFYLSAGYADFQVLSSVAELTPDRSDFFVTYTVSEGQRYQFGEINVVSQIDKIDPETLLPLIEIESGEWYNANLVDDAVDALTDSVGDQGYAFIDIRPNVQRNRETGTIDITFNISEGPKVYVERINVVGNVRTLDEVIRREFRLVEGDAFSSSKMQRSKQRIENLNFFKSVDVKTLPGASPDQTVIEVDVEEKSTGEFSIGAGYGTDNGAFGQLGIRERNLLGKGQDLRLNFTLGSTDQQIDLSFTEPYFLDREIAAGFDVYRREEDNQDESSYDEEQTGGRLRAGFRYSEELSHSFRYSLESNSYSNINRSSASRLLLAEETEFVESAIGHTLTYDERDSSISPTEGYFARLSNDLAGVGGDEQYLRSRVEGGYYYPIDREHEWVLSTRGSTGYIFGFDDDTRISQRFSVGGSNLRGFESAGVGPRDIATGDALGSKLYYTGTVQLDFPLGLPSEFALTGRVFSDFGSGQDVDGARPGEIYDTGTLRSSVGFGVGWESPFGPIGVDISQAVTKEDHDKEEMFRLNFGTRF
ncbi:MAG: outer membrane protein assembly factor BamA [Thalassospira sp.]|uniref:outer membrane protein assembly factor BamA n=1 Tax=unclassified Thalassospira TaxID=2648997 RepID=UPI000C3F5D75|nr:MULTISPECIES: outer membrane protein assembly factor BamA [unclassified Thalassospira]MBE71894.1 outer membrane protein assembly factor BamA [Thalassospira sp.]QPO13418.1 outer membrane protein assembly factor BamA [Thalassospira sp. A40-3]|tara:strand:- start:1289 stop:3610 length:2322 start_codon:yes stop_codon:yes gene_type:complete